MKKKSFKELFDLAKERDTYWVASLILDFTEGLHRIMEANGVSRSELARRLIFLWNAVLDGFVTPTKYYSLRTRDTDTLFSKQFGGKQITWCQLLGVWP